MGSLTVKYINVNKDTELDDFGYDPVAYKIIPVLQALQDMGEDATVVIIKQCNGTQKEKSDLIRDLCRVYNKGSYVIVCTGGAGITMSLLEFPSPEKYNPAYVEEAKKPLHIEELFSRERKMLEELRFININKFIGSYGSNDVMIYTNGICGKLFEHWGLIKPNIKKQTEREEINYE